MSKRHSDTTLLKIIELSKKGFVSRRISKELGVSKSFVNHFLNKETRFDFWAWFEKPGSEVAYTEQDVERAFQEGKVEIDTELQVEAERQAKQRQRFQDMNRIERKAWREKTRYENAVDELNNELVTLLHQKGFQDEFEVGMVENEALPVGIIHLTDLHFNEEVDLPNNQYNFDIAAKRLAKLVQKAKTHFHAQRIQRVVVACTGDFLNSDRRLDELLANADVRSRAVFKAVDILQQVIRDLLLDFHVTVTGVVGNESRLGKDVGWNGKVASDNFDYTIFKMLEYLFADTTVNFIMDENNPLELVMNIRGKNILLLHGHNGLSNTGNIARGMAQKRAQYADMGVNIDYALCGHIHESLIADLYARGSSLVGANEYSDKALNLSSRASQNIFVVNCDGVDGFKIDVQDSNNYIGYQVENDSLATSEATKEPANSIIHMVV